jgi:hypothetical protein
MHVSDDLPDLAAIVKHLQANAATLGLDLSRLGLYVTSGHSPVALTLRFTTRVSAFTLAYAKELLIK